MQCEIHDATVVQCSLNRSIYLGEKRPLLGSPSTPKGPDEYMLLRKKSWSMAGDDAARRCGCLPDPCSPQIPVHPADKNERVNDHDHSKGG